MILVGQVRTPSFLTMRNHSRSMLAAFAGVPSVLSVESMKYLPVLPVTGVKLVSAPTPFAIIDPPLVLKLYSRQLMMRRLLSSVG